MPYENLYVHKFWFKCQPTIVSKIFRCRTRKWAKTAHSEQVLTCGYTSARTDILSIFVKFFQSLLVFFRLNLSAGPHVGYLADIPAHGLTCPGSSVVPPGACGVPAQVGEEVPVQPVLEVINCVGKLDMVWQLVLLLCSSH